MTGDFTGETQLLTAPAANPALMTPQERRDAGASSASHPTEAELRSEAKREAQCWKASKKRGRPRAVRRKWGAAAESIQEASRRLQQLAHDGHPLSDEGQWLRDNSRLLKTALQETHDLPTVLRSLPYVETGQGEKTTRVYAAAAGFWRATAFVFNERAFVTYFDAIQDATGPFEIRELWALKPMMQVAILQEIANVAERIVAPTGSEREKDPSASPSRLPRLINSLRDIGSAEWKDLFEELSEVGRILRQDPAYSAMDFESRNLYRGAVEALAEGSQVDEPEIARRALGLAHAAGGEWNSNPRLRERRSHVGYYLIDKGKDLLKRQIGYRARPLEQIKEAILNWPEVFYLVGIELLTFAVIAFLLSGLSERVPLIVGVLLLLLPATEAAVGVLNQSTTFLFRPRVLPKLDFSKGIPAEATTMVVVPTLLISEEHVRRMARELEIRYLANRDPNLHFALLTDSPDSTRRFDNRDELVALCSQLIGDLNRKYEAQGKGSFFLFHRQPVYNPTERTWMGWERKRGKLLDFNNLLRQGSDNFPVKIGDLSVLSKVRYVLTLDSDTQLPRGAAHRLIGTLAHPLNRAVIDPVTNTVVEGYGILQPRVGISVHSASRSRLANIYSGQTEFDIYTRASSDVYQDLFGEGIFTGKGIYEVDVFQRVLEKRFPCNAILSHDLIEGAYARAGLVSDIEVIDDYPSRFSAYSRRKHRWVRGDWQITRWLLPRVRDSIGRMVPNPLGVISRWKILDNLRRSLLEISMFVLLLSGWFFLPGGPVRWTLATLVLMLIPSYVRLLLALSRVGRVEYLSGFLQDTGAAFVTAQVNVFFMLAFLSHQTLVTLDAILRTVVRLTITRRKLLQWETAAEAESGSDTRMAVDVYLGLTPWVSAVVAVALADYRPEALLVASPVLVLWACSKPLARWLNRSFRDEKAAITAADEAFLRRVALRTWRFFRQFSTAEHNWLVPDNVQEDPPAVATRISPTNLGMLLDARVAACKLGYLTLAEFASETERTLEVASRLPRFKGHFFNWYDTRTLQPLDPPFVSTVDSGNLACSLWALKQGCLEMARQSLFNPALWRAIRDCAGLTLEIARSTAAPEAVILALEHLQDRIKPLGEDGARWIQDLPALEEVALGIKHSLASDTTASEELQWWVAETSERLTHARHMVESLAPWLLPEYEELVRLLGPGAKTGVQGLTLESVPFAIADLDARLQELASDASADRALRSSARSLRELLPARLSEAESLSRKLGALATLADNLAEQMDFRCLYNPRRKVLSVGYNVPAGRPEASCYELLASETRTAVFVAIAKGDVPQESWLHLGRAHVAWKGQRALLSWSGTMFEYLMPALWMKSYPNTILEQSLRAVVRWQQEAARIRSTPWGISEAASSKRDQEGHYQYEAFGIPALAIKPTPSADPVVAPYATALALAVDAPGAVRNLRRMEQMKWLGRFGFYDAADFTPPRVKSPTAHEAERDEAPGHEIVRCWMAHHQGMSLLAISNLLADSVIRELFHSEPRVAATERLLHERVPLVVRVERAEDPQPSARQAEKRRGAGQAACEEVFG